MGRPRRIRIAHVTQHLIQRGNNRTDMFRREDDYEVFAGLLRAACSRWQVDIHGYVFMRTHIHLVATPRIPAGTEKMMQTLASRYSRYFNARHGRTGTLYEGRYRPAFIDNSAYWYSCLRYVELNPVRAGIVSSPDAYYWCSYLANACGQPDPLVTQHPLYLQLGETPAERQACWRRLCAAAIPLDELARLRAAAHRGGALEAVILEPP